MQTPLLSQKSKICIGEINFSNIKKNSLANVKASQPTQDAEHAHWGGKQSNHRWCTDAKEECWKKELWRRWTAFWSSREDNTSRLGACEVPLLIEPQHSQEPAHDRALWWSCPQLLGWARGEVFGHRPSLVVGNSQCGSQSLHRFMSTKPTTPNIIPSAGHADDVQIVSWFCPSAITISRSLQIWHWC